MSSKSSKTAFEINDRVFAKVRGYLGDWPAKISGISGTSSRPRYSVNFCGTDEYVSCKPEDLFPYEQNKFKPGIPNKNDNFIEALLEIENDTETLKKKILRPSLKRLGGLKKAKKNISDIILEKPTKKFVRNKRKVTETSKQPSKKLLEIVLEILGDLKGHSKKAMTKYSVLISKDPKLEMQPTVMAHQLSSCLLRKYTSRQNPVTSDKNLCAEEQNSKIIEKPFTSKTVKCISKIKDGPTSSNEISSNSSSEHSKLNKGNSKQMIEMQNARLVQSIIEDWTDVSETSSSEESIKNSEIIEKPSTSKTVKCISKIKDGPTSSNEISSNSSNVARVLQSAHRTMPKEYAHYQYDSKKTEHSRLSKGNSKQSPKTQIAGSFQTFIEGLTDESETSSSEETIQNFEIIDKPSTSKTVKCISKIKDGPTSSYEISSNSSSEHSKLNKGNSKKMIEMQNARLVQSIIEDWTDESETSSSEETIKNSEIIEKPSTSKTVKCISKIKDGPTSSNEISSNSSNVARVLRSAHRTMPKEYAHYQYDSKITEHSRLSKGNSKQSPKTQIAGSFQTFIEGLTDESETSSSEETIQNFEILEKPSTSKTVKCISKIKDGPTSSNEISSNSSSEHSKLNKGNSKQMIEMQNARLVQSIIVDWTDESETSSSEETIKNSEIIEKPSTSKTVKCISKIKDGPTSSNEISSNSSNVARVLRSAHRTMPKEYAHYQYDSKKTEYSRLSKGNSKQSPKTKISGLFQTFIEGLTDESETSSSEETIQNSEIIEKPSTSKTVKCISKIKDGPTTSNEISSNSSNVTRVLRSAHRTMPKEYAHYQYDSKKTEYSRLSKGNSKQSPKTKISGLFQTFIEGLTDESETSSSEETIQNSEIIEKPSTSKTVKCISKIKDGPTTSNEISSNSSNVTRVLRSAHRTMPKEYAHYQYDSKKTEHLSLSKGNSKQSPKTKISGLFQTFIEGLTDESETSSSEETIQNSEIIEKPSTSKTVKCISKIKDGPTSSNEISSNSSNVTRVLRSAHKTMPKEYAHYQYDSQKTEHLRLSKGNSKQSPKTQIADLLQTFIEDLTVESEPSLSLETIKTKGSNTISEFQKSSSSKFDTTGILARLTSAYSCHLLYRLALQGTEMKLQGLMISLCSALGNERDYDMVIQSLKQMNELQLNSIMLKKNCAIVNLVRRLTVLGINKSDTIEYALKADQIRHKAEEVYRKFKSLFYVPEGRTFEDVFKEVVDNFITNTQHLAQSDGSTMTIIGC